MNRLADLRVLKLHGVSECRGRIVGTPAPCSGCLRFETWLGGPLTFTPTTNHIWHYMIWTVESVVQQTQERRCISQDRLETRCFIYELTDYLLFRLWNVLSSLSLSTQNNFFFRKMSAFKIQIWQHLIYFFKLLLHHVHVVSVKSKSGTAPLSVPGKVSEQKFPVDHPSRYTSSDCVLTKWRYIEIWRHVFSVFL